VTALQAARAAAMLRRDLDADVELEAGPYGSFQVRVDDTVVVDGGTLAFLGVLPTLGEIREQVAQHLNRTATSDPPTG
jgi:hypothetical protein